MMNNGFTPTGEFYNSRANNMCFDNKAMVASLPSVGNPPQASVRLNITDPEKNHPAQTQTTRIRFRNRIRLPYVFNLLVSVIVFAMTVLLEFGYIPPSKSGFYCNDPALSHKYTGETIGATTLMVGNLFAVPFLVLFLSEFVRKGSVSRICLREVWYFYKEFLTGFALVLLITEVAKALIGEHRPHFFDICQPDAAQNCTHGQYIEQFRCTVTKYSNYFIVDTSRSFPSGHSSLSFFVAVYLSYLIQCRLPISRLGPIFKTFFIASCIAWALICSLTRISDKRHHWWDVVVGIIIGITGALYSISTIHRRLKQDSIPRVATSTTTLLDIKNKDAKSEII